jgi:hypothetical protein
VAGLINDLSASRVTKTKPTTQGRNTTTAVDDDNDLFFDIGESEVWVAEWTLFVDAPQAADIKYGLSVPSGATVRWGVIGPILTENDPATVANVSLAGATTGTMSLGTDPTTVVMHTIKAWVKTTGTDGIVMLQWAQNVSDGTDTLVMQGSHLCASRETA